MINVAAIRMQQFGVQFYQASLTAEDIDKLVRFEVLSYGEAGQPVRGAQKKTPIPLPLSTKVAPAGKFAALRLGVVESGSVPNILSFIVST